MFFVIVVLLLFARIKGECTTDDGNGGIVSVPCGDPSDTTMPSSTKKSGSSQLIFNVNDSSAANDPENMKYIIAGGVIGAGILVVIACIFTIARRKGWQHDKHKKADNNRERRDSRESNETELTTVPQPDKSGFTAVEIRNLGFPSTEPEPIPKASSSLQGPNRCNAPASKKYHKNIGSL